MSEERRKLRVLVITMGSERQQHIENLFEHPNMSKHFETPVFSPGVSSRSLRNRVEFFRIANEVGILPPKEWEALQKADPTNKHTEEFFDCLKSVPITQGRRGSKRDVALHYSTELWYKAKTINRGRSVLGW